MPFKTAKIDYVIFFVFMVIFLWGFFIDSFRPVYDKTGEIIIVNGEPLIHINMSVFIVPIILISIMFVLLSEGKPKLHELPWKIYYLNFKDNAKQFLEEKMEEHKKWKNR